MNRVERILDHLKIDSRIFALYKEEIEIPHIDYLYKSVHAFWYPHPPFFLPLFGSEIPNLTGIVIHPFHQKGISFGKYGLEDRYISEVARNSQQLLNQILFYLCEYVSDDFDEGKPDVENFTRQLGGLDLKSMYNYVEDNFEITKEMPSNDHDTPMMYSESLEAYDGGFISTEELIDYDNIDKACSYEIANRETRLANIDNLPPWLDEKIDSRSLFEQYIKEKALDKAWLTLNNDQWTLKEIASGLLQLKNCTDNELFHLIADNWIHGWENSLDTGY